MLTRRHMLYRVTLLGLAVGTVPLLKGCTNAVSACADPALLSVGEAHMRSTLEYVERTPNAAEQCNGCEFFRVSAGDCGQCEILNGAVSRLGSCNSWVRRGTGPS